MNVIWHDHVGVDAQVFIVNTKPQAVLDDVYWFGIYKNRQPIDNGEGDKVNINTGNEFLVIHYVIIFDKLKMD